MVYSTGVIHVTEVVAAQKRLALLLSNNLMWKYPDMSGFIRARVLLTIVSSNTLLLHGARDKEAYICQRPNLADGAVMALLALWRV